ncbi:hypothetical protein [Domibacillus mangrovi]|uniref:hypothetical protein n=1 Tax=Domibacillus mangrovi TaxID=1714354 RepID=UPI0009F88432|nr:hypothetical protein [Domibacillus mangrovi]
MNTVSLIFLPDEKTIRIAIDSWSKMIENIDKKSYVSVAIFVAETNYTISGKAGVAVERILKS